MPLQEGAMRAAATSILLASLLTGCASATCRGPTTAGDAPSNPHDPATPAGPHRRAGEAGAGDPHVATADNYTTTARAFWKADNEARQPGPDQDVYVLVLHGRFACTIRIGPIGTAPRARLPTGQALRHRPPRSGQVTPASAACPSRSGWKKSRLLTKIQAPESGVD
jgi:hypothetical protein